MTLILNKNIHLSIKYTLFSIQWITLSNVYEQCVPAFYLIVLKNVVRSTNGHYCDSLFLTEHRNHS